MGNAEAVLLKLFGPELSEVNEAVRKVGYHGDKQTIVYDVFPEVHVKCPSSAVAEAIVAHFGPAVFGVGDVRFEAVVGAALVARGWTVATAESCTGGLIGHMITNTPGSSHYFIMGVVAYSNEAKVKVLGVPTDLIEQFGAVSEPVVKKMAEGIKTLSGATVTVAVSGIAGPGGGSPQKPVGTVWLAVAGPMGCTAVLRRLKGTREEIKLHAAYHALDLVRKQALAEATV